MQSRDELTLIKCSLWGERHILCVNMKCLYWWMGLCNGRDMFLQIVRQSRSDFKDWISKFQTVIWHRLLRNFKHERIHMKDTALSMNVNKITLNGYISALIHETPWAFMAECNKTKHFKQRAPRGDCDFFVGPEMSKALKCHKYQPWCWYTYCSKDTERPGQAFNSKLGLCQFLPCMQKREVQGPMFKVIFSFYDTQYRKEQHCIATVYTRTDAIKKTERKYEDSKVQVVSSWVKCNEWKCCHICKDVPCFLKKNKIL